MTLRRVLRTAVFAFAMLFALPSMAKELAEAHGEKNHEEGDKPFKPTEMIMHHIADAHEFHLWGEGHESKSIPLPVILFTENGLVTFMSSEFIDEHHEPRVVEKNGLNFVNVHEKIYQLEAGAHAVEFDAEHHPVNAIKPLDFSITKNVFSMFLSVVIILLVFIKMGKGYKKRGAVAPKGMASFLEPIILFIRDDVAKPNLHNKTDKYMPFLLTIFFFIWLNNIIGLVPIFPGSANLTGNISFTLSLAFITFLVTTFSANKSYWKHIFATPGVPIPLLIIMIPVEVLGMFTKPFALMIRLFANITAGHIIILSLVSIIFIFKSLAWSGLSVPFMLFMNVLELLVAFLQAFIFTMLAALFIGAAVEESH